MMTNLRWIFIIYLKFMVLFTISPYGYQHSSSVVDAFLMPTDSATRIISSSTNLNALTPLSSALVLPSVKALATTAVLPTAVGGLYRYEYAVSYGYGTATALSSYLIYKALLSLLPNTNILYPIVQSHALAIVAYGIRLNIFLLYRELFIPRFRHMRERIEERRTSKDGSGKDASTIVKMISRTPFILSCSMLYAGLVMPPYIVAMLIQSGVTNFMTPAVLAAPSPLPLIIYKMLVYTTWFGFGIGAIGDVHKSVVKAKKGQDYLVTSGIYKYLRHPNYTGEVIGWSSSFFASMVMLLSAAFTVSSSTMTKAMYMSLIAPVGLSVLGFLGIVFVLCAATSNLEKRQEEKYGANKNDENSDYQRWIKSSWKGFSLASKTK